MLCFMSVIQQLCFKSKDMFWKYMSFSPVLQSVWRSTFIIEITGAGLVSVTSIFTILKLQIYFETKNHIAIVKDNDFILCYNNFVFGKSYFRHTDKRNTWRVAIPILITMPLIITLYYQWLHILTDS